MRSAFRGSELFGPTIQGEGPYAGRRAWFLRLAGCNLSCSWCDTPYTWDASRFNLREETRDITPEEVGGIVPAGALLVVTGGEPLLQEKTDAWRDLLDRRWWAKWIIQVETNGTIAPSYGSRANVQCWVVSPKLENAGSHRGHQSPALDPDWARVARESEAHLKIVCETREDVAAARALADAHGWPVDKRWIMPQGTTAEQLGKNWQRLAEAALEFEFNITHRLHVLAWGEERAR